MKTSFLKISAAMLIGLLPIPMQAAPKKEAKKQDAAQADVRRSAPQQARAPVRQQARPQQVNRPVQRAPVARSAPKPAAKKAPTVAQQPRKVAAPQRTSPQRSVAQRPQVQPKQNVQRSQPARTQSQRSNVAVAERAKTARETEVRSQPREKAQAPAVARQERQERSRDVETRRPDVEKPAVAERQPEASRNERANIAAQRNETQRQNQAERAAERKPRKIDQSPENAAVRQALDAEKSRDLTRARPGGRGNDRDNRLATPRDLTDAQGRDTVRDLTALDRPGRDGDRRDISNLPRRFQDKKDRRPKATAEERQLRLARAETRERATRDRQRLIAQREARLQNQVESFRENRQRRVAAVQDRRQALRAARTDFRSDTQRAYVQESREEIRNYWEDRGDEVRYRTYGRRDHLFDDDWWDDCHWRHDHIHVSNPWWWWEPAHWASVNLFIGSGWAEPLYYDYGTDIIYDDAAVYAWGEPIGTPLEYSYRVIEQANPPVQVVAEAPVVETEWTPLGVWALVQENQGDAIMFFQLSVNKAGTISGAYANVVSGEKLPVVGRVDQKTQRAAWHIGDKTQKVFEAGIANLSENQASVLVHVAPGEMQPWLLVRMESPYLPDRPTEVSGS